VHLEDREKSVQLQKLSLSLQSCDVDTRAINSLFFFLVYLHFQVVIESGVSLSSVDDAHLNSVHFFMSGKIQINYTIYNLIGITAKLFMLCNVSCWRRE
jgi:hypothetical protein